MESSLDGNKYRLATNCLHAGQINPGVAAGVINPLYPSTAFPYLEVDKFAYPRYFNTPNQEALVTRLCTLEQGEDALVFSSGMAAIFSTFLALLDPGDHAIFQNDLYGGTHHAITAELDRLKITYTLLDEITRESLDRACRPETRFVYIETPSNPLLNCIPIDVVAEFAREKGILSLIDNTFASPVNQNPLVLGMDVVFHSATKYLGGHSDISAGVVISSAGVIGKIRPVAVNLGGNLNSQMCHLLERSIKTLEVRVTRQNENAQAIAEFLSAHAGVANVFYPGLRSHPTHEIAARQMKGFGGMLSFEVKGDPDAFVRRLRLIAPVMSLGAVESTISSPRLTSHAKIGPEGRKKVGISDQLLRLSVGIEAGNDLIDDLGEALKE